MKEKDQQSIIMRILKTQLFTKIILRFTAGKKKQNFSVSPVRGGFKDVDEVTEQFNRILKDKNDEIQQLKRQIQDSDESMKRAGRGGPNEGDVTKLINELQHLNAELTKSRQNEIRLSSMIQNYENQINRLTDVNMKLSQELKELGEQNQFLVAQLQGQNPDARIRELQLKHSEELNRLHAQLREAQLNAERNQNSQNDLLKRQNAELVHEVERLTQLVRSLQQELAAKGDNHQLNIIIQQRNQELEDWKNRYNLLADERSRMEQKIVLAQTELMRLENQVKIWKDHCDQIQRTAPDQDKRIAELQARIADYESKINLLTIENQKLNQLLQLKDNETEKIKRATRQSQVDSRTLDALQNEIYQLKEQLKQQDYAHKNAQQEWATKIILLTNELDKVNTHLKARNQEYEDLAQRYNQLLQQTNSLNQSGDFKYQEQLNKSIQLGHEVEKLAGLTRNQADEIQLWKNKYAEMEGRYNQQLIVVNQQTNEVHFKRQIQDLEDQLRRKTAESAEWQQSFVNLQAQKERELNSLMETLKKTVRESNSNVGLQNEYNRLKESVQLLTQQIEQLNRINIEKDNEIRMLRLQAGSDTASKEKIINLENKIVQVSSELQNQINLNQIKENEIQSLRRQLQESRGRYSSDIDAQLIQLRSEIQTLKDLLQQKENIIADLHRQISQFQSEEPLKRSKQGAELQILQNQLEELKFANARLIQQNNEQAITIDKLNKLLIEQQQSSSNVTEQNRKIESLLYQIEVLEKQFRQVAEERDNLKRQLLETETLRMRIREVEAREAYLNEQIRKLNAELEDSRQDKIKRSSKDNEMHGLQVRVNELQVQNEVLKGEINKLNNILRMKDQDLESIRKESNRKSMAETEKSQLDNKILLLASEIDRLSRSLQDKHEEVKRLNMLLIEKENSNQRVPQLESRLALVQEENNRLNGQIRLLTEDNIRKLTDENLHLRQRLAEMGEFERQKVELDNKIALLASDRERLNIIITTMSQEKLALQAQLNEHAQGDRIRKELEYQVDSVKREKNRLEESIGQISSENNELRKRLGALNEIDRVKIEYENKIALLSSELERLRLTLNAKNEENAKLVMRINESSSLEQLRLELESRIKMYAQDNERLNGSIRRLSEENTNLQTRIANMSNIESVKIQLENQINLLVAENKRLNDLVRAKDEELVATRDIRARFELFQSRNVDALSRLVLTAIELERVHADNREKSNKIVQLEQRLRDNTLEYQNQSLQQKVNQLTEQLERLVRELESSRNELINVSRKYQQLESEKLTWNAQREKFEQTIAYLQNEINRLMQLNEENEKVKKSKMGNDNRLQELENENKQLRELLDRQRIENEKLLKQVNEMSSVINELRFRLQDDSLQRKVSEQEQTIKYLNGEISRLSGMLEENERVKKSMKNDEGKLQQLESQNRYLNEQLERLRVENSNLVKQINELTVAIQQLQVRINDNSLEMQNRSLQEQLKMRNMEFERIAQEVQRLNQHIIELTNDMNRLKQENLGWDSTKRNLENQVREYTSRIELLTNELNRLTQANNELNIRISSSLTIQDRFNRLGEAYVLQVLLTELLTKRAQDLSGFAGEIEESRKKAAHQKQEREVLLQKIQEQENRIQELYNIIAQREREAQDLKAQNGNVSVLQIQIQQYEGMINDLKRRHAEDLENVKRMNDGIRQSSVQKEVNELTLKFNIRVQELEREALKFKALAEQFENELRAQRQQNQELLQRLVEAENRSRENEENVKRSKAGIQNMQTLQDQLVQLAQELERYKNLYIQEKNHNAEFESQKSILAIEIERLNAILKEKLALIEDFQRREGEWRDSERFKYEVQSLRMQIDDRNKKIEELVIQIQQLQSRVGGVAEYENKIALLSNQIQTLSFTLEQREKEKQQIINKYESDIKLLQTRISELTQIITQLKAEGEQYSSYTYQIENLRREVESLSKLLAQSQEKYNQASIQITELTRQIQQLQYENSQLKAQLDSERDDNKVKKSMKDKNLEDQNKKIEGLIQEINRLTIEIQNRDKKIAELASAENSLRMFQYEKESLLKERESLTLIINRTATERDNALQRVVFLTTRLESIDEANKGLNMQIQILSQQLQSKDKELRDLINAFQELQVKLQQELDNSRRSSSMANSKWIQDKQQLEQEVNRLKSELSIVEHRHHLTIEEIKRQMEVQLAEELRKQHSATKAEYERKLNDALNAQREQYDDDKERVKKSNKNEVDALKNQLETTIKIQLEQQLKEIQIRMEMEMRNLQDENKVLKARNNQLEEQVKNMQNQLMDSLGHEQDTLKWKEIVERLEMQRQREIAEFRQILEESRNLHIDSSGSLQEAERTAYNTQIKQLSLRVSELVENLKVKDNENNEIRSANAKLIREKSEMKMQVSTSNANMQFQMEIESLKRQLIQTNDGRIEMETQIKRYEAKVNQLEIQLSQVTVELQRANEQLSIKKMERDTAFSQIDQLKSQTLSMSHAFSSVGGDSDLQKSKFEVLQREIDELTTQRNMYKDQSERKSDELNRKNLELVEKIGQLDKLKLLYEENNNKIYILETKLLDKLQTEEVHIM